MEDMPKLEIKSLSRSFGTGSFHEEGISFCVDTGQCLAIVGPSGAGKTTLLRCVAGLLKPDSGSVLLDGTDITGRRPSERGMAMIFQDAALFPHMDVAHNVTYGLHRLGYSAKETDRMLEQTAALLGLESLLNRYPASLSAGEAQRVGIGRAIIRSPKILLLDEPLSNLDARLRDELRMELLNLKRKLHMTMIMVTHDQSDAMLLGDLAGVMNQGKLMAIGTPEDLYQHPHDLFTASFLGTPAINLLDARMSEDHTLSFEGFRVRMPEIAYCGNVTMAVRPEHLKITDAGIAALADTCLRNGSQYLIQFRLHDGAVMRMMKDTPINEGSQVYLSAETEQIMLFDPSTGQRICPCIRADGA